jgi:hypothetical protein
VSPRREWLLCGYFARTVLEKSARADKSTETRRTGRIDIDETPINTGYSIRNSLVGKVVVGAGFEPAKA